MSCNSENCGEETAFILESKTEIKHDKPLQISIALNDTYAKKTACSCVHDVAGREYDDVVKILKEKYNIELNITYFMEMYDMEDAIKAKKFDGLVCKPWSAYMFAKPFGLKFKRVADILDPNNNQWLTGVYLVLKDSPINKLEDINGKIMVAGEEDSYEKYHAPFKFLKEKGIKPSKLVHKSSCLESINVLIDNQAEVAVVSDYVMSASCAVDVAAPEDFKTIGITEKGALCSVMLDMDRVSKEDATRLQSALLEISGKNIPESFLGNGFVKPASWKPTVYTK